MGAVCSGSQGSILEDLTVEWTNGSGYLISGDRHIVRGVRAFNNGMSGIRGEYCTNCLVELSTSKYNNWKGYNAMWESGGGKWLYTTNSTFRKLNFSDNEGPGLWLDMDNFDNVVEQSRFDNNLAANLFLEWTTDRTMVRNNVLTRARSGESSFYGHGLLIHAANNNIILHNTFMGNDGGGLRIRADERDKATGNLYYNNLFIANDYTAGGNSKVSREISFEEHYSVADALTNKGDGNVFWHRTSASSEFNTFYFRTKGAAGGALFSSTLAEWQSKALTDYHSSTIQPGAPHVINVKDFAEGWRLANGSQVIGKSAALHSTIAALQVDFDGEPRPALNADPGADQYSQGTGGGTERVAGGASGNGVVTALDASLILQHASGLLSLNTLFEADASGDGSVSAYDASLILQFVTGFISCLPANQTCTSNKGL
jgi:hypothetical protein